TSVSPNPMRVNATESHTFGISGSNFRSGLTVSITYEGVTQTFSGSQLQNFSSTLVDVAVSLQNVHTNTATTAIRVTNSDGHASNVVQLPVTLGGLDPHVVIIKTGTGSGTVTADITGYAPGTYNVIDCGTLCDAYYTIGTGVQLHAVAAAGSVFTAWG